MKQEAHWLKTLGSSRWDEKSTSKDVHIRKHILFDFIFKEAHFMLDRDIGRRFLARIMDYLIFVPVILLFLGRVVRLRPAGNPVVTALVLLLLFFR